MKRHNLRGGFSLVELLVAIGIIVILVSILVPTVSRVRQTAYATDSQAQLSQLAAAIERYHADFRAYPGPIPDAAIGPSRIASGAFVNVTTTTNNRGVTAAENLVLGLLGGMTINSSGNPVFLIDNVGNGPLNLNVANPKRFNSYADKANLSNGFYLPNDGNTAFGSLDTEIPEFVDRFPDPMPVLYLRAGRSASIGTTDADNPVVTNGSRAGAYDLADIFAYTASATGTGKDLSAGETRGGAPADQHGLQSVLIANTTLDARIPAGAYAYLLNPSAGAGVRAPKQKDAYILISAGRDRVYGTRDDLTNFGTVGQ
jgi:prepilin-type N-terminal cleavage/methylation domain-containing protein